MHEPVQRAQEEGVERQVAHLLQLEVSAQALQPPGAPDAGLQRLQSLAVLPQMRRQLLAGETREGVGQGAGETKGGGVREGEGEGRWRRGDGGGERRGGRRGGGAESCSATWSTHFDTQKRSPSLSLVHSIYLISCF